MKRSGGVTVAAVVLIVISALVASGAFFASFGDIMLRITDPKMIAPVFARMLAETLILLAICLWGIATGAGLLRLRRWAWFCVLAIGVLLIAKAVPGLGHAQKLIRATTGVPTVGAGTFIAAQYAAIVFGTLIPLALAIWWLLLFTRRSVTLQFAASANGHKSIAPGTTVAASADSAAAYMQPAMLIPPPRTGFAATHPPSISVVAICLLAGAAFFPLIFLYPPSWRITAIFGILVSGRKMILVSIPWFAANLALGVGLLRLKPWARVGSIAYCIVGMVNGTLSARSTGRLMDAMHKAMGVPAPPLPPVFMRAVVVFGLVFTLGLNLAAIYFLVTRRAAFYRQPPAPSSPDKPAGLALDAASPAGGGH